MKAKTAKPTASQADLLAQPAPKPAPPVALEVGPPKSLEYTPLGGTDLWRVERFAEFCAEFPLPTSYPFAILMGQFHEVGKQYERGWRICRQLYGIGPMFLTKGEEDPGEYEPKTAAAICAGMRPPIDGKQLVAEMTALRGMWDVWVKRDMHPAPVQASPAAVKDELPFGEDVLREFGFEEEMFEVQVWDAAKREEAPRAARLNRLERDWFCKRVREAHKQLSDPGAGALVRTCLMNELYLKRFEADMAKLGPSSKKWKELQELRQDLEQRYEAQLEQMQVIFPETATAAKDNFLRVISDLNRAHREYYGNQSSKLIDQMFTANEVEVMLRASPQRPPQYRLGLTLAVMEAQRGLWDPNWKPAIKLSVLRKLDDGFREAMARIAEELGEALVDLEKGVAPGEGEDFEDLIQT